MTNQKVIDHAVAVVMRELGYRSNTGTTEGIFLWEKTFEDGTTEFLNNSEAEQKCSLDVLAEVCRTHDFVMLLNPVDSECGVGKHQQVQIPSTVAKTIQEAALIATSQALEARHEE